MNNPKTFFSRKQQITIGVSAIVAVLAFSAMCLMYSTKPSMKASISTHGIAHLPRSQTVRSMPTHGATLVAIATRAAAPVVDPLPMPRPAPIQATPTPASRLYPSPTTEPTATSVPTVISTPTPGLTPTSVPTVAATATAGPTRQSTGTPTS